MIQVNQLNLFFEVNKKIYFMILRDAHSFTRKPDDLLS